MPDLNRNAGFITGKSTSPTTTYVIVDVDDELNDLFSDKNLNGEGSYNRLIEDFEFELGQLIDHNELNVDQTPNPAYTPPVYTGIIQNHSRSYNEVTLETSDINRKIDDTIWEPLTWRLKTGIGTGNEDIQTTLPVSLIPDYQQLFETKDWYLENAEETGAYAQIGAEKFWYTAFEDVGGVATFTGVKRGQLDTTAVEVAVPASTTSGNGPEIKSLVVLHENATDIPKMLITGQTADGRPLPKGWHVGEDIRWINEPSFAAYSSPLKLRFEISAKQKCRDFYEREVLALMGAVLATDGRGRLTWTSSQTPIDAAAGEIVLDESNCSNLDQLRLQHVKKNIHPSFKIGYDWNESEGKAQSSVVYHDEESESHNNIPPGTKLKEFTFKGLRSGIHTSTQLQKLAATYGDNYFYEKQSLIVESHINGLPLGYLPTVNFPNVRDDANGAVKSLSRTMLIMASRYNRTRRKTTYTLSGSLNVQSTRQASQRQHNLEIAEYKRGKINIATLPGISIVGGVATGNITLAMGEHYYYVDDDNPGTGLEFSSSMNVSFSGTGPMVGLHVFGPFDCKATLDLTGRSNHAVGIGGTQATRATSGDSGYALSSRSTASMNSKIVYISYLSSDETVYSASSVKITGGKTGNITRGLYARAPDPALNVNNGILGGLPSDLGGTAGPGGPSSEHTDPDRRPLSAGGSTNRNPTTQYITGSNGGVAGGGLLIVSWGGAASRIILDGRPSSPENGLDVRSGVVIRGARGGPGMPGSLLWVVDGNHARPLLNELNVEAYPGDASVAGISTRFGASIRLGNPGNYRTDRVATERANLWESVVRIAYTPDPENVQQQSTGSQISEFFSNQRDGRVRIIVADVDPSNANLGDMRITQAELDANQDDALFRILTEAGWRDFVRGVDDFEYVYDALIAGKRKYNSLEIVASPTRPVGEPDGTIWFNQSNGTEWILYENSDDILIRESQVPVGTNLIEDLSFARSGAGDKLWLFTRDDALAPVNSKTSNTGSTGGGGGGTNPTTGITLSSQGRTVTGVAYQDDGGGVIVAGRGGTVTLADATVLPFTVGAGGAFSVTFPSTNDNNAGQMASVYTQNAAAGTQAQLNFTYETA
ncbi:hypothetical protein [uncultured Paraglaciecola sp.]|uniref:hypothetical protein n=1 Tax=uncultured Paraglaciecola sp. TaxID=1765024 RepID=UPI0026058B6E|nr:hypothetical protein [uncultured Paraglaciecola sp.]